MPPTQPRRVRDPWGAIGIAALAVLIGGTAVRQLVSRHDPGALGAALIAVMLVVVLVRARRLH